MKKLFLAFLALGCTTFLAAQVCAPNDTVTTLVFPAPESPDNPDGGIQKIACIGSPFDFVFTVNVPDTFLADVPPFPPTQVPLDSAVLQPAGSVINLPDGLFYNCNPSDCVFLPLTKGCAKLEGTPSTANQPGVYSMAINFTAYVQFAGLPFDTDYTYPDTVNTPDRYLLNVKAANDPACVSGIFDTPIEAGTLKIAPNPAKDLTFAMVELHDGGTYQMQVYNATGAIMMDKSIEMSRGDNLLEMQVADWANGVYWLTLSNGLKQVKRAFVVAH